MNWDDRRHLAEQIGDRVRELRQQLGLTQAEVSRRAGIARANLIRLELSCAHAPSTLTLLRIARALEVDLAELVKGIS